MCQISWVSDNCGSYKIRPCLGCCLLTDFDEVDSVMTIASGPLAGGHVFNLSSPFLYHCRIRNALCFVLVLSVHMLHCLDVMHACELK